MMVSVNLFDTLKPLDNPAFGIHSEISVIKEYLAL